MQTIIRLTDDHNTQSIEVEVALQGGQFMPLSMAHQVCRWVIENLDEITTRIKNGESGTNINPNRKSPDSGGSGGNSSQEPSLIEI
jgi:hypothetical protein